MVLNLKSRALTVFAASTLAFPGVISMASPAVATPSAHTIDSVSVAPTATSTSTEAGDNAGTASASTQPPQRGLVPGSIQFPGNDGQPHRVTFDKNSFMVDGERLNIWSGEIHYWRVPDVNAWRDLFQKMRANGYNAVSLYFFWGLHQREENGEFDFEKGTIKDIDLLLTMAKEEGLYVIARPGPYVNAEISMGGLPAYMTNFSERLRSTDSRSLEASKKWLHAFNEIAKKHMISDGGGSIILYQVENELISEDESRGAFLRALAEYVRADGVNVPLFHNDYGLGGRFHNAKSYGLDFYAYDKYPVGFNCSQPRRKIEDSEETFRRYAPETPHFITESQGGAFTPWGASYQASDCYRYTDENFTRQWGVNNIGNGVTAFNFYMAFGGTNWGWTGSPSSGFTSYDYGAGITEDRMMTPKSSVQKEMGYFMRAVPELAAMNPVAVYDAQVLQGNGGINLYRRQGSAATSASGNGSQVIAIRHSDSNHEGTSTFTLPLSLGASEGAQKTSFDFDDRNEAIAYSQGWERVEDGSAYEGTLMRTSTQGATARLTFTGTGLRLITSTGTDHGEFTVKIDEITPDTVTTTHVESDQNKPTQFEAHRVENLPNQEHTVVITNTGGQVVTIDAIDVLEPAATEPIVHNDNDRTFITYGDGWQYATGKRWTQGDYQGDETYTKTQGASYSFTFTGVGFDLVAPWSTNHGSASVTVDGAPAGKTHEETTRDATPQKTVYKWRAEDTQTPTSHTVTVTNDGIRFEGSSDTYTSIDAIRIYPDASSLPVEGPQFNEGEIAWARVPQKDGTSLVLHGRDALLLTADHLINGHKLYYTTSQLFGAPLSVGDSTIQYAVGHTGDAGETVLHYAQRPTVSGEGVEVDWNEDRHELRLNYIHRDGAFNVTVTPQGEELKPLILRVISRNDAQKVWILEGTYQGKTLSTAVEGVELARVVSYSESGVALTGSSSQATSATVFSEVADGVVTWNGVQGTQLASGRASVSVAGPQAVTMPELRFVRAKDQAESTAEFDDSAWKTITETRAHQRKQGPGQAGVVLDSNFHGFYEGSVWYRAHFTAASDNAILRFNGNGGTGGPSKRSDSAFMQVWVNGHYAGARPANGVMQTLHAPEGSIRAGEKVVVSVIVHNLGQNLDWSDNGLNKQNRGLYDAVLPADGVVTWKISGASVADSRRAATNPSGTLYNNGGLGGEKAGWHMPGFDDTSWEQAESLHSDAGITWYRARFTLNEPQGQQSAYRLDLNSQRFAQRQDGAQVTIFVNGWNTGVYIGDRGPQNSFVIPSAFLNPQGENVVSLAVASKEDGMGPESVSLRAISTLTWPEAPAPADPPTGGEPAVETPKLQISGVAEGAKIVRGENLVLTVTGAPAGSTVTVTLSSVPHAGNGGGMRILRAAPSAPVSATGVADDSGTATVTLPVAADTPLGKAVLTASVEGRDPVNLSLEITEPVSNGGSGTGNQQGNSGQPGSNTGGTNGGGSKDTTPGAGNGKDKQDASGNPGTAQQTPDKAGSQPKTETEPKGAVPSGKATPQSHKPAPSALALTGASAALLLTLAGLSSATGLVSQRISRRRH